MENVEKKDIGVATAIKQFFGYKEGDTLKEFALEVKKLTQADREWFAAELSKEMGVTVTS